MDVNDSFRGSTAVRPLGFGKKVLLTLNTPPLLLDSQRKALAIHINVAGRCDGISPVIRHEMMRCVATPRSGRGYRQRHRIRAVSTGTLRMDQREQYIDRTNVIHV